MPNLSLKPMLAHHIQDVVDIETAAFTNPWTQRDFEFTLKRENAYCRVIVVDGEMVGYLIGFFVQKEFHLADFSVKPEEQRRGFGRKALSELMHHIRHQAQVISLEVRMSNGPAIALYKDAGFQTMAIRKGYYSKPSEDALVMLKPLHGKLSDWVTQALAGRV